MSVCTVYLNMCAVCVSVCAVYVCVRVVCVRACGVCACLVCVRVCAVCVCVFSYVSSQSLTAPPSSGKVMLMTEIEDYSPEADGTLYSLLEHQEEEEYYPFHPAKTYFLVFMRISGYTKNLKVIN